MPKIGTRSASPSPQEDVAGPPEIKPLLPVPELGILPLEGSPWVKKEVKVKSEYEDNSTTVDRVVAWVYGPLAIWPASNDEQQWWYLDHTPTKAGVIILIGADKRDDLMKIGELLVVKCSSCLREDTIEEIREARPVWLVEWIKRCKEANAYVDP